MDILEKLKKITEIKENEPLAEYTTFKIGGSAKYFCRCSDKDELVKLIKVAEKKNLPYFLLGGGSNLLVSDEGFNGLVINLDNSRLKIVNNIVYCDAGVSLSKLVGKVRSAGLSGLEWAVGIPGTVGGAIRGNAGAYAGEMKDSVSAVKVLRRNKIKTLKNKDCKFNYRNSVFKTNQDIILSVSLKLVSKEQIEISQKMKVISDQREKKFNQYDCAGCVFKNIELSKEQLLDFKNRFFQLPIEFIEYGKIPAAWLIDQCGCKGRQIGGAKVLEDHAAIIINVDKATAQDVLDLMNIIKKEVDNKFGIKLEKEIVYLDFKK